MNLGHSIKNLPAPLLILLQICLVLPFWSLVVSGSPLAVHQTFGTLEFSLYLLVYWIMPPILVLSMLARRFVFVPALIVQCLALLWLAVLKLPAMEGGFAVLRLVPLIAAIALLVFFFDKDQIYPFLATDKHRGFRRAPRLSINSQIKIRVPGKSGSHAAMLQSISASGAAIGASSAIRDHLWAEGAGAKITIDKAGGPELEVVWVRDDGPVVTVGLRALDERAMSVFFADALKKLAGDAAAKKLSGAWARSSLRRVALVAWGSAMSAAFAIPACGTDGDEVQYKNRRLGVTQSAAPAAEPAPEPRAVPVARIQVFPADAAMMIEESRDFVAFKIEPDGKRTEVTSEVEWTGESAAILPDPTRGGRIKALAASGPTRYFAKLGSASGAAVVTVAEEALLGFGIKSPSSTPNVGMELQLRAIARTKNGEADVTDSASWLVVEGGAVLSDTPPLGRLKLEAPGVVKVEARFRDQTAELTLNVKAGGPSGIIIVPEFTSVTAGRDLKFSVRALFPDAESDVTSSAEIDVADPGIVKLKSIGVLTGVAAGTAKVTARLGELSASVDVMISPAVLEALKLSPPSPQVIAGETVAFLVTGSFSDGTTRDLTSEARFASADGGVAAVLSETASVTKVRGIKAGETTITAKIGTVEADTDLIVTPAVVTALTLSDAEVRLPVGVAKKVRATATYSDGTTSDVTDRAVWESRNSLVATVVRGDVTISGQGSGVVAATFGGFESLVSVTGLKPEIKALALSPTSAKVPRGLSVTFEATATFTDGSQGSVTASAAWKTSDLVLASSNGPVVTGLAIGFAKVTATVGSVAAEATLEVTSPELVGLSIKSAPTSIVAGRTQQFEAVAHYSDTSERIVTNDGIWLSSVPSIAQTNDLKKGEVKALKVGSATITATFGGKSAQIGITVTPAVLESIGISPTTLTLAVGGAQNYTASSQYSDGTSRDVTTDVAWSVEPTSLATIGLNTGKLSVTGVGSGKVRASLSGISGSADLTTSNATNSFSVGSATPYTWIVPSGVTSVAIKAWGAGGGAFYGSTSRKGGGAAYASGKLAVTQGQQLFIYIGGGGAASTKLAPLAANGNADRVGASGGGLSGVMRDNAFVLIAGGGGGAGYSGDGGAGGPSGENGGGKGGKGGSPTAGGQGGCDNNLCGLAGTAKQGGRGYAGAAMPLCLAPGLNGGGAGCDGGWGGAGGGGGVFGGGGGAGWFNHGGGGGSSMTTALTAPAVTAGSNSNPGNASAPERGTAGNGGIPGTDALKVKGQDGRVEILIEP